MEQPNAGSDRPWLRDFIAGALDEVELADSALSEAPLPDSWMHLLNGPSPGEASIEIGHYQITKQVGRGGMGVVLQAFDSRLRRPVAIKFLSPQLAASPLARIRFTREAQAVAAINHPNVVMIHDIGEHEGLPYLVMEYVDGISLAERLRQEGRLEFKSILRIGIQVAKGLAAAHSQGVIHRDVKPENILLESGIDRVKIGDFGLAYVAAEPCRLTSSGVLLGTPAYMSPEQAAGAGLDHCSDLFSLGSVLYHLCTGEQPFPGPSVKAILTRVRSAAPRPVRDLNPEIPREFEYHISRLMAKDPLDRFASAGELVRTLVDCLAEIQGTRPNPERDNPDHETQGREHFQAGGQSSQIDIEEFWQAPDTPSLGKRAKQGSGSAESESPIWRRVLKFVGVKRDRTATPVSDSAPIPGRPRKKATRPRSVPYSWLHTALHFVAAFLLICLIVLTGYLIRNEPGKATDSAVAAAPSGKASSSVGTPLPTGTSTNNTDPKVLEAFAEGQRFERARARLAARYGRDRVNPASPNWRGWDPTGRYGLNPFDPRSSIFGPGGPGDADLGAGIPGSYGFDPGMPPGILSGRRTRLERARGVAQQPHF
jgi:serine/threonine protein kinase